MMKLLNTSVLREPRRSHKKTVKTGTKIVIPHNAVVHPAIVGCQVRTHSTTNHTIVFLKTNIEAFGGDTSKVNLSYTHAYNCRIVNGVC